MKEIPLTQGKVAFVDDADYEHLSRYKWYANKDYNTFYALRKKKNPDSGNTLVSMHAEIIGKRDGMVIDHVDGNGLNNQRDNLRHVTNRQNAQNRKAFQTSKYPGVHWDKWHKKWRARIMLPGGKKKNIGCFVNEKDAYLAYKAAVEDLGEKVLYRE